MRENLNFTAISSLPAWYIHSKIKSDSRAVILSEAKDLMLLRMVKSEEKFSEK
jgi:hypothetical protein